MAYHLVLSGEDVLPPLELAYTNFNTLWSVIPNEARSRFYLQEASTIPQEGFGRALVYDKKWKMGLPPDYTTYANWKATYCTMCGNGKATC